MPAQRELVGVVVTGAAAIVETAHERLACPVSMDRKDACTRCTTRVWNKQERGDRHRSFGVEHHTIASILLELGGVGDFERERYGIGFWSEQRTQRVAREHIAAGWCMARGTDGLKPQLPVCPR